MSYTVLVTNTSSMILEFSASYCHLARENRASLHVVFVIFPFVKISSLAHLFLVMHMHGVCCNLLPRKGSLSTEGYLGMCRLNESQNRPPTITLTSSL